MSLVRTLGKVALGIAMAKGVGKVMGGSRGSSSGGGLSSALGGLLGGGNSRSGGLGALGSLIGGGSSGGLGGILSSLGGSSAQSSSSGGLGGMLNSVLQGNSSSAQPEPTTAEEQQAEVLLKAMISAAKADGQIDEKEQSKITDNLGDDITQDEVAIVRNAMQSPLDVQGLINSVPAGMEQQVYLMSLYAINLDSQKEAQYLDQLAKGLNISQAQSNAIHEKLGAPQLYS